MTTQRILPLTLAVLLAACGAPPDTAPALTDRASMRAVAAASPALDETGGSDLADHECQVVLRSVMRMPGGPDYETDCSSGSCLYVWRGTIEVAEAVAPEATVHVLYHATSGSTWWEVTATPEPTSAPGFRRYAFALSDHLFGPEAAADEAPAIELVGFARLPGGARLFDHNRFAGAFENHVLTAESNFGAHDGGVCQPVVGSVYFHESWDESTHGARRQGGYLHVGYDIDRLPHCRGTHNGYPAWDIVAYVKFLPGGQLFEGSVRELGNVMGRPTNDATDRPFVVRIPEDANEVELWFRNYTGAGSSCEAWDSNLGANYHYDVWPRGDDPRCLDVERETGVRGEDHRMAHNAPYCLPYELDEQADAGACELHVQGFGNGHIGHYGIPYDWLLAYLRAAPADGEVLNTGMFTRYHERDTGAVGQRFSLGVEVEPGLWRAGFAYLVTGMNGSSRTDLVVDELAFFADVRRPDGSVARLWQSRQGANYRWEDAFALPTYREYIPYGSIAWASDAAAIYESRHACW